MIDQRRRDLDVLVLHDEAGLAILVHMDERRERRATVILDADLNVVSVRVWARAAGSAEQYEASAHELTTLGRSASNGSRIGIGAPSRSATSEDSPNQLGGANAPQNVARCGSLRCHSMGAKSGSPV